MQNHWIVLIPPVVVLLLGYLTRRVVFSLACGITVAALVAADFHPLHALTLTTHHLLNNLEFSKYTSWHGIQTCWSSFIFLFLYILSIYISLVGHSGGAYAYVNFVKNRINSARSAELSSIFLSACLCIDDYFSTLTVGSVIQPLTDQFRVPRAKLAFLVSALSSSITVLVPLSTFFAYLLGQLHDNGISLLPTAHTIILADPLNVYLRSIPFTFYSFIIMSAALFIVIKRISYGTLYHHETIAQTTGNLFGGKIMKGQKIRVAHERNIDAASFADFIIPMGMLFIFIITGILASGGYRLFGGTATLLEAFRSANAAISLFGGGAIALTATLIFYLLRSRLYIRELPAIVVESMTLMTPAIITLLLAWVFGDFLKNDLQTGRYLADIIIGSIPVTVFPLMFYGASFLTAFAIGSSWATLAILSPIALQMLVAFLNQPTPAPLENVPLVFPVIGALLSGAIVGNHVSPISDTTVMSATSTCSYHVDHVQTKLEYTWPALCGTGIAFLLSGFLVHTKGIILGLVIPFIAGIALTLGILQVLNMPRKHT